MDTVIHVARSLATKPARPLTSTTGIFQDPYGGTMWPILNLFFVQAMVIIALCRGMAIFGDLLRQPPVIFEIAGGIILGPSAIGKGNLMYLDTFFPLNYINYLGLVANIGLTLYLFLVGIDLDTESLATYGRKAGLIAICGMALPFGLGVAISRYLFNHLQANDPLFKDVKFTSFYVFIGTAMCITAFPVLARILKYGGLIYTRPGAIAMAAAALNDAIAWCLLTLAIAIANSGDMRVAGYIFGTMIAFFLVLYVIVRPVYARLVAFVESLENPSLESNLFALNICFVFLCAWITAFIGLDAIFGAFLWGLVVPRKSKLIKACQEHMEELITVFAMPLYFALSGLKTNISQINSAEDGRCLALVVFMAVLGKVVACGGASLLQGMSVRESGCVAFLMNTRGLVELIVLNLGLQAGILNTRTFTIMVLMAIITTFITNPIVEFIYPPSVRVRLGATDKAEQEVIAVKAQIPAYVGESEVTPLAVSRLAVVVDGLTNLPVLSKLLVYFAPHTTKSHLAVTAMRFVEPTNTHRDEFLALDDTGRVLRIDEEPTDVNAGLQEYVADDEEGHTKRRAELFPLSLLCRSMHAAVNAFRIQGDPDEFAGVLEGLRHQNSCDMVVLPFRANSLYFQKFFWSIKQGSPTPLALCVSLERPSGPGVRRVSGDRSDRRPTIRARGMSLFNTDPNYDILGTKQAVPSTVAPKPFASPVSRVLSVIIGCTMDMQVINILARASENTINEVTVLLPKDHAGFPAPLLAAIEDLKKAAPQINFVVVNSISTDFDGLYSDIANHEYDLFVVAFAESDSFHARVAATLNELSAAAATAPPTFQEQVRTFANRIIRDNEWLRNAFNVQAQPVATHQEVPQIEMVESQSAQARPNRTSSHNSEDNAENTSYLELGPIGNKLYKRYQLEQGEKTLLIVHQPRSGANRRASDQTSVVSEPQPVGDKI